MGAEAGKQARETEKQPADLRAAASALIDRYRRGQSVTNAAAKARGDERIALWRLAKVTAAARAAAARLRQAKDKKIGDIAQLEKEAAAAAAKVRQLSPPYNVLKEATEQLGHCRNETKPDTREQLLKQLPCGKLFIPSKDTTVDKEWDRIAHGMVHAARLRQAQQQEEAERERLLDWSNLGMLRLLQDFRRGKEVFEVQEAKMTKYPAAPPPRLFCEVRRPW
eukprot:TRINITY_DN24235_c0_g5_i1.p2 TRINITY_DN24235_c0_g5~~TRINITY_DN24235_c0_g5_i1.p2  ORF type:complete len:249 (+),score=106.01 TRINITY_DN24235_c0_g5_i1:80-748(+)